MRLRCNEAFTDVILIYAVMCMQLPLLICPHQMVNYTISIINETVNRSDHSIRYTSYGPYFHLGPGTASHAITSGLERDKEYSAMVNIWVERIVIQSHEVLFGKLAYHPSSSTGLLG